MMDPKLEFLELLEQEHSKCALPHRLKADTEEWVQGILSLCFPHLDVVGSKRLPHFSQEADRLDRELDGLLISAGLAKTSLEAITDAFWKALPTVRSTLVADAHAIDEFDPASESVDEVFLAYPGFYAMAVFRIAHVLYKLGVPLLPRIATEFAHRQTGIDIHPGATIGAPFVIDHGTGLVIGETAVIGERVKVYQGVTIGAMAVKKRLAKTKRHPTVEDDVIIYANATLLGGETIIGARSVIGGGMLVTSSVPPDTVMTHPKLKT